MPVSTRKYVGAHRDPHPVYVVLDTMTNEIKFVVNSETSADKLAETYDLDYDFATRSEAAERYPYVLI